MLVEGPLSLFREVEGPFGSKDHEFIVALSFFVMCFLQHPYVFNGSSSNPFCKCLFANVYFSLFTLSIVNGYFSFS